MIRRRRQSPRPAKGKTPGPGGCPLELGPARVEARRQWRRAIRKDDGWPAPAFWLGPNVYEDSQKVMRRKVLVTGPAGRIGVSFTEYARTRYQLRLGLRTTPMPARLSDLETVTLDIADPVSCRTACRGMDTVVHLAAEASAQADFYATLLDRNVRGVYNILQAAAAEGCRRVVLSSSIQAVAGYPLEHQIQEDAPPRPLNMYGATKAFAEAIGHVYAQTHGLSCLVVRIGTFEFNQAQFDVNGRNLSTFVSARDMAQLLCCCVDAEPTIRYGIVHGVSNNRYKRLGLTQTRALVGYAPQDDAFVHFNIDIPYRDRWYEETNAPRPARAH